jgi:hypothetical protein
MGESVPRLSQKNHSSLLELKAAEEQPSLKTAHILTESPSPDLSAPGNNRCEE